MSIFYAKIDNNITRSDKSNQQSAKYDCYLMIIIQISFILKKTLFLQNLGIEIYFILILTSVKVWTVTL